MSSCTVCGLGGMTLLAVGAVMTVVVMGVMIGNSWAVNGSVDLDPTVAILGFSGLGVAAIGTVMGASSGGPTGTAGPTGLAVLAIFSVVLVIFFVTFGGHIFDGGFEGMDWDMNVDVVAEVDVDVDVDVETEP